MGENRYRSNEEGAEKVTRAAPGVPAAAAGRAAYDVRRNRPV